MGHINLKWKVFLRSGFFSFFYYLPHKCVQDVHNWAVPRWGFYGEIKENQEGYHQFSWHSKSEDGVGCSPLIEDTFERCLTVCQMGFHWSGNPSARGTSSGRVSHEELHCLLSKISIKYDKENIEWSSPEIKQRCRSTAVALTFIAIVYRYVRLVAVHRQNLSGLWSAVCVTSCSL